ncbi:hypothetical protein Bbelb_146110 [Branchiostoma belcheri]|nr:hypothetical protein Bbelb_146110 [Branchiostoma belcheri]
MSPEMKYSLERSSERKPGHLCALSPSLAREESTGRKGTGKYIETSLHSVNVAENFTTAASPGNPGGGGDMITHSEVPLQHGDLWGKTEQVCGMETGHKTEMDG